MVRREETEAIDKLNSRLEEEKLESVLGNKEQTP